MDQKDRDLMAERARFYQDGGPLDPALKEHPTAAPNAENRAPEVKADPLSRRWVTCDANAFPHIYGDEHECYGVIQLVPDPVELPPVDDDQVDFSTHPHPGCSGAIVLEPEPGENREPAVCPVCGRSDCFWATHPQDPKADREKCKYEVRGEPPNENAGPAICPFCGKPIGEHREIVQQGNVVARLCKNADIVAYGRVPDVVRRLVNEDPPANIPDLARMVSEGKLPEPVELPPIKLEPISSVAEEAESTAIARGYALWRSGSEFRRFGVTLRESALAQDAYASGWLANPAVAEAARLTKLINTPEILDFVKAVTIEAVHQRERWGAAQDEGKEAADWFWLLGYLAGKALRSDKDGDREKLLHHIITTAAACANWHAQVLGKCDMRPGIATPEGER